MKRPHILDPVEKRPVSAANPRGEAAIDQAEQQVENVENPWITLAGIFADDPTLMPMLDEIYAARDADRKALDAEQ